MKPITPKEVAGQQLLQIPDAVIETFNECIGEKYVNGNAIVLQERVVEILLSKGFSRDEIFDKGWLNIEGLYRKAGWIVRYDKPGYNETGKAYFDFRAK